METRTILIAEDDTDLAHFLTTQCRLLGFDVFRSPDAMHALLGTHRLKPSLLVIDLNMPGGNGLSVCEMLASDPEVNRIPVIVMSGQSDDRTIRRCQAAGARFVPKGPKLWSELSAAIGECLSDKPPTAPVAVGCPAAAGQPALPPVADAASLGNRQKLISIDDDPGISEVLKLRLEPYGVEVYRAFSGMQGFWSCLDFHPNVIISDLKMSDGDGSYILQRLRNHSLTQNTPVIILTGEKNPAIRRELLSQGAEAYLHKPLILNELLEHLRPFVRLTAPAAKSR